MTSNRGDQVYARCPAHDDTEPSLSITWASGPRGGLVKLKCHGHCDFYDVVAALGLRASDTFDTPPARPDGHKPHTRTAPAKRPATAKPRPVSAEGKSARASKWTGDEVPVATYTYVSADGVPVFDVIRWDEHAPAKFTCRSYTTDGRRITSKKMPKPERRVLYRLPQVRAAVAAGELVYVVEGEKDADSLAERAGVCATTNPSGAFVSRTADLKWFPQYTKTLYNAHVVLVADVDPLTPTKGYPGYRHVINVAHELQDVAASVSIVRPRQGKDATDHLDAGYGVDDFEPVELAELVELVAAVDQVHAEHGVYVLDSAPAAAPAPAADPEPDPDLEEEESAGGQVYDFPGGALSLLDRLGGGRGGGGGGGGAGGDGGAGGEEQPWKTITVRDEYVATPAGLFKVVKDPRQKLIKHIPVLSVPVKIVARYTRVLPDEAPAEMTHLDLEVHRQGEVHLMESVDLQRWESGSWVNDLPWLITAERHTAGRSTLRKAIEQTSGEGIPLTPLYGALGWQEFEGRQVYVHAGGAIDANGVVEGIRVVPAPELRPFALPAPPSTMEDLQRAVYASVAIMDAAPARIAAPLLGAAYRAVLGYCPATVHAVGTPATGKTSLAAVIAQHFSPDSRHDRLPGAGAGENAGTVGGLAELRFLAGDMLLPLDDLAPDKGPQKASERLATIARSQYNREGRVRLNRKSEMMVSHPPRGLPIVTGEESTSVMSAESRIALIRFLPGDLDLSPNGPVAQLSHGTAPQDRAALTAAMVRYYAARMPVTDWLSETVAELTNALTDPAAEAPGLDARHAGIVAELAAGWRAMLDMAVDLKAINESTAAELWNWAWEGLVEAKRQISTGQARRTAADRVRELVQALLFSRKIALYSREGGTPPNCEEYGWEASNYDGSHRLVGEPVGWTDGDKVWFLPPSLFPHLERQANAENEPLSLTKDGLAQRLADAKVISVPPRVDAKGRPTKGANRNAVQRRMQGKAQWVWEVEHSWLFPPEELEDPAGDDDPTPAAPTAPAPRPPAPRTEAPAPVRSGTTSSASPTSSPREDVTPEPAVSAAERPQNAPAAPATTERPRKPGRRAQGSPDAPTPTGPTYLTAWLREQHPEANPEDLAAAEQLWAESMRGIEFRGPLDTARRILNGALRHQSIPDLPQLDRETLAPAMVDLAGGEDRRPNWWRSRTRLIGEPMTEGAWVASFDVNGFYPSAADIELGTGDPVLTESDRLPSGWDKCPGWLQLDQDATEAPYGLHDRLVAGLWVPVPLASYLEQLGKLPAVRASLLWPKHRRWLRPHVAMFRDARALLKPLEADSLAAHMAHRAVKAVNTRLFGGVLRSEKYNDTTTLRPDWASMIESTAEARMYRALDKVDQSAARVIGKHVDAAWFEVAAPDVVPPGLMVSDQYGKFKPHGVAQITPKMIEAHRVGRWKTIYDALEKAEGRK